MKTSLIDLFHVQEKVFTQVIDKNQKYISWPPFGSHLQNLNCINDAEVGPHISPNFVGLQIVFIQRMRLKKNKLDLLRIVQKAGIWSLRMQQTERSMASSQMVDVREK